MLFLIFYRWHFHSSVEFAFFIFQCLFCTSLFIAQKLHFVENANEKTRSVKKFSFSIIEANPKSRIRRFRVTYAFSLRLFCELFFAEEELFRVLMNAIFQIEKLETHTRSRDKYKRSNPSTFWNLLWVKLLSTLKYGGKKRHLRSERTHCEEHKSRWEKRKRISISLKRNFSTGEVKPSKKL